MEWVIPSGFLRNIPRVPDRTGNELKIDQEWTRTSPRDFMSFLPSRTPGPFLGFLGFLRIPPGIGGLV
jgi:hypothetical protein